MLLLRTEQSRDKQKITKRKYRTGFGGYDAEVCTVFFLQGSMPKDKIDFLTSAFVTGAKCSHKSNTVQLWSNEVYYM